ncbi:MAG: hypothetical protein GY855_04560 [candidate division Zixibacteria bacterium]|nr:hypothetical protein [candidate division Zixibacteria bacterium]
MKKIIFILILVVIIVFIIALKPDAVQIKDQAVSNLGQLMASLFIVALLMERALDVFLSTWRAEKGDNQERQIRDHRDKIKEHKETKTDSSEVEAKLQKTIEERAKHRHETRLYALWAGLFFGLIISAVGIRSLGSMVDIRTIANSTQLTLFNIIDVVLTGGIIAGGSDGIHKMMEVYLAFMETTKAKAQNNKPTP